MRQREQPTSIADRSPTSRWAVRGRPRTRPRRSSVRQRRRCQRHDRCDRGTTADGAAPADSTAPVDSTAPTETTAGTDPVRAPTDTGGGGEPLLGDGRSRSLRAPTRTPARSPTCRASTSPRRRRSSTSSSPSSRATSTTCASTSSCCRASRPPTIRSWRSDEAQFSSAGNYTEILNNTGEGAEFVAFVDYGKTPIEALITPEGGATDSPTSKAGRSASRATSRRRSWRCSPRPGSARGTDYSEVLLDGFDPQAHLATDIDALPVYKSNEPGQLDAAGVAYKLFDPTDDGHPRVVRAALHLGRLLRRHPTAVEDFARASLKGMEDAIADPEAAVGDVGRADRGSRQPELPHAPRASCSAGRRSWRKCSRGTPEGEPVGLIDPGVVRRRVRGLRRRRRLARRCAGGHDALRRRARRRLVRRRRQGDLAGLIVSRLETTPRSSRASTGSARLRRPRGRGRRGPRRARARRRRGSGRGSGLWAEPARSAATGGSARAGLLVAARRRDGCRRCRGGPRGRCRRRMRRRSETAVLVDPVSTCGVCDRCTAGLEPYCENLRTIGSTRQGGFAELVATPGRSVSSHPRRDDVRRGGVRAGAYMTAWHALVTVGACSPARPCSSTPPAPASRRRSCSSPSPPAPRSSAPPAVRKGGQGARHSAVRMPSTTTERADVAEAVLEITNGRGVDLVVDHVGQRCSMRRSVPSRSTDGWCSAARPPARASRSICRRSTTGVAR